MFKFVGVVAVLGTVALGAAVYTGVLDFSAPATVTPKGEQQVQELRNSAADAIRGVGEAAGDAVEVAPVQ